MTRILVARDGSRRSEAVIDYSVYSKSFSAEILISGDLGEVMSPSDRIAAMYGGKIVDILPATEAEVGKLRLMMAGQAKSCKKE